MSSFIDLEKLFPDCDYPVYAHTRGQDKEPLREHIDRCIKYFKKLDQKKNFDVVLDRYFRKKFKNPSGELIAFAKELFWQVLTFHDTGKNTPEFQNRKMKNKEAPDQVLIDETAQHSLLSSLIYFDYYYKRATAFPKKEERIFKKIILLNAYVIAKHHSDMDSLTAYLDDVNNGNGKKIIKVITEQGLCGYKATSYEDGEIKLNISHAPFDAYDYFYCRFVYSIVVACDYYATTEYMSGIEKKELGNLEDISPVIRAYECTPLLKSIRQFELHEKRDLNEAKDINELRSNIFLEAENGYRENPDDRIYYLKAPTGSGKTNMALNLSYQMMKSGKKLFYIYPFNTLIEQTWNTLRQLFPESVLENFTVINSLNAMKTKESVKNEDEYYQKALLDRQFFNDPCILSTHVSFFNLLFGNKREAPMGFFQLCDSVVVLDEIQSYRNSIWAEIISMLQVCAELMGMRIIIMSATLPDLTMLTGDESIVKSLIGNADRYFKHPLFRNRVELSFELLYETDFNMEKLKKHIMSNNGRGKLVLVEFISKISAEQFYRQLAESEDVEVPIYCITGDDSIIEREKILNPIRDGQIKEAILIATQVVEAGVDIDMDVGYKDVSIFDSEEQFLGRINRSCRKNGIAYFFNMDKINSVYHDDYRTDPSLIILKPEMQELLKGKDFDSYYKRVLEMMRKYRTESTGKEGLKYFLEYSLGHLDFHEVAERMELIEENAHCVRIFFRRKVKLEDGSTLDSGKVWNQYKELLMNQTLSYAEKRVKLSEVQVQMNCFIYQINEVIDTVPDERIGELYYIENGEYYFTDGKLNRDKLSVKKAGFY